MKPLVRLDTRPSRDGKTFVYRLVFKDETGKRRRISLGHTDRRKAERQRLQKERELNMGIEIPVAMRLSLFAEDSLDRTGDQIRQGTRNEYALAMKHFIEAIGDIDYRAVRHKHAELFLQMRMDAGDCISTIHKKLRGLKRFFRLAVDRGQIEYSPFTRIKYPKIPKKKVRIFSDDEWNRLLKAAQQLEQRLSLKWNLILILALTTGMRKSELLNTIWSDIDFEAKTINVSSKKDNEKIWKWQIKDSDWRQLPLTNEVVQMLADHQVKQPEGYPYVFVPPTRYEYIQGLRRDGKWTLYNSNYKVITNFNKQFNRILSLAGISDGKFHDLRRTALSKMLFCGLSKYDLMVIAGHASFETTQQFYLAVGDDLVGRARVAVTKGFGEVLTRTWHALPLNGDIKKTEDSEVSVNTAVRK